jgi:hypothetical protein
MGVFPSWNWNGPAPFSDDEAKRVALAVGGANDPRTAKIELIYIAANNEIHHKQQTTEAGGTNWLNLPPLAGETAGKVAHAHQIALCANTDGVLELIYTDTSDNLFRVRQTAAGSATWGLSIPFPGNKAIVIAVVVDSLDRLNLFYVGNDHKLFHNRQNLAGSSDWVGETPFPGITANTVAAGLNADGFLEVFYTTTVDDLYHFVQTSTADIKAFVNQGQFGKDRAKQIAVGTNEDGRLEIFYVGSSNKLFHNWQTTTADLTQWSGETRFPGRSAEQVNVVRNMDGRLELFYVATNSDLCHVWQVRPNGTWVGEVRFPATQGSQVASVLNLAGQIEICSIGKKNVISLDWQQTPSAGWLNVNGTGGIAASPNTGLTGNSNYSMSNCDFLTDVQIVIEVTEEIRCEEAGFPGNSTYPPNLDPSDHSFGWQINCISPAGSANVWQQYGVQVSYTGGQIAGFVENWLDPDNDVDFINKTYGLGGLPNGGIPAGYTIQVDLLNDQDNANIIGILWSVADENGDLKGSAKCVLLDHGVKPYELAPIVCVECVLVGFAEGNFSMFSSGAGDIRYASSSPIGAISAPPACGVAPFGTGESSSSTYGTVSSPLSDFLFQNFGVAVAPRARSTRLGDRPLHDRPRPTH